MHYMDIERYYEYYVFDERRRNSRHENANVYCTINTNTEMKTEKKTVKLNRKHAYVFYRIDSVASHTHFTGSLSCT